MLDIDTEEELVKLVGGKFRLTALIQKRMAELNRGAPYSSEFLFFLGLITHSSLIAS